MSKVYCYYHSADLDGHCSAAIVWQWCREWGQEFVPRPVNYGQEVDWLEAAKEEGAGAVIVDFTPGGDDPAQTLDLMAYELHGRLLWIDHHRTAILKVGESDVKGARGVGFAACELTWECLCKGRPMPDAVRLLGRYDVFDRRDAAEWEARILPFQYGMRLQEHNAADAETADFWEALFNEYTFDEKSYLVQDIIGSGRTALKAERMNNKRTAEAAAYDCVFEGLLCCAINARGNSLVLDDYALGKHKMRVLWGFAKNKWLVSLYENGDPKVDCGALAQKHGGGGHKGAAGFSLPAELSPLVYFKPEVAGV